MTECVKSDRCIQARACTKICHYVENYWAFKAIVARLIRLEIENERSQKDDDGG